MNAASPAYTEMIDFIVSRATPEALLQFRPSESTQHRVADLVERQHRDSLSSEESSELDDFVQLEHLMIMAKAQARLRVNFAGGN